MAGWIMCLDMLPENHIVVKTKIHDHKGKRNEQRLFRFKALWLDPKDSTYVYWTPTHWKPDV